MSISDNLKLVAVLLVAYAALQTAQEARESMREIARHVEESGLCIYHKEAEK